MNRTIKYGDAIKTPKCGWKYAAENNMIAITSEMIGRRFALNAKNVYDWAIKHKIDYEKLKKIYIDMRYNVCFLSEVLDAILSDKPLK